jgi:hypothetical protein
MKNKQPSTSYHDSKKSRVICIVMPIQQGRRREACLPLTGKIGVLHPSRRHGWWGAAHRYTSSRVDDRDGIATTASGRLVQLEVRGLALKRGGDERRRGRVEREGRCYALGLLRGGRIWRVAGKRGPFRRAVDGHQLTRPVSWARGSRRFRSAITTHIVVCQQVGAELEVVLKIEGSCRLKTSPEVHECVRVRELL